MENKYKKLVVQIRDWLRNYAEDETNCMTHKVHKDLWNMVQSIEHDLEEIDKGE